MRIWEIEINFSVSIMRMNTRCHFCGNKDNINNHQVLYASFKAHKGHQVIVCLPCFFKAKKPHDIVRIFGADLQLFGKDLVLDIKGKDFTHEDIFTLRRRLYYSIDRHILYFKILASDFPKGKKIQGKFQKTLPPQKKHHKKQYVDFFTYGGREFLTYPQLLKFKKGLE